MKIRRKKLKVEETQGVKAYSHPALPGTPSKEGNAAFTLAEVVITLIVIGVVSAVTIPMLSNDVNDKKWNVGRQKAQATIGEAFKLATINGYVTPDYDNTKDFVTKVLTKYLKINKICDTAVDCGFSSQIKRPDGKSSRTIPTSWTDSTTARVINGANGVNSTGTFDTVNGAVRAKFNNSAFFQTLDGFSVAFFYNPYCAVDENDKRCGNDAKAHYALDAVCMNAVYDMNGKQGPNRIGQDIGFVGTIYNGYGVKAAAVLPHKDEKIVNNSLPNSSGSDYWIRTQHYCAALHENDWKVPDLDELTLMYLNRNLLKAGTGFQDFFYSNNLIDRSAATIFWFIPFNANNPGNGNYAGRRHVAYRTSNGDSWRIQCVRSNALK